jgi:hypothetical protein
LIEKSYDLPESAGITRLSSVGYGPRRLIRLDAITISCGVLEAKTQPVVANRHNQKLLWKLALFPLTQPGKGIDFGLKSGKKWEIGVDSGPLWELLERIGFINQKRTESKYWLPFGVDLQLFLLSRRI